MERQRKHCLDKEREEEGRSADRREIEEIKKKKEKRQSEKKKKKQYEKEKTKRKCNNIWIERERKKNGRTEMH